ncbi:hypothetical protein [Rhodoferax sp.]|uniref:hypothetical protein n=1 Tax=Rhodoferax sp. TaxID=50421 RepID=UPI0025EB6843|nr:hypothetical protein [Rhodoferax sp.]
MKQTKPFGRAYLTAADSAAAPSPTTIPAALAATASSQLGDLFSLHGAALPAQDQAPAPLWQQKLREWCVLAATVAALLSAYVMLRDSMLLANWLQQVTTDETVMVCKDGKMVYPDYSIVDRLLNNGHFMCTEWKVQRGYLSLPRR